MNKTKSRLIASFVLITTVYGVLNYLTESYYCKPHFSLGTRNDTRATLRNGTNRFIPNGKDTWGILVASQEDRYMDPPWPVPEKIIVAFDDESGENHIISLNTELPSGFRGKITIVIFENNASFKVRLEQTAKKL
jgi:hypothetical protein